MVTDERLGTLVETFKEDAEQVVECGYQEIGEEVLACYDALCELRDRRAVDLNESERLKAWIVNRILELMVEECSDFNQDEMREILSSLSMDNVLNQFHLTLVRRADKAMSENPIAVDCVQDADLNESEREELERLRTSVVDGVALICPSCGACDETCEAFDDAIQSSLVWYAVCGEDVLDAKAEEQEAELARLRAENADLQKTIDEQNDDINMLAEERQRLRAVVAKLGDAEMVVPVEWKRRGFKHGLWVKDHLIEQALYAPGVTSAIEDSYGVIRLREAGEGAP